MVYFQLTYRGFLELKFNSKRKAYEFGRISLLPSFPSSLRVLFPPPFAISVLSSLCSSLSWTRPSILHSELPSVYPTVLFSTCLSVCPYTPLSLPPFVPSSLPPSTPLSLPPSLIRLLKMIINRTPLIHSPCSRQL